MTDLKQMIMLKNWLIENEARHDQAGWFEDKESGAVEQPEGWCGTSCCAFGAVALMNGYLPVFDAGATGTSVVSRNDGVPEDVFRLATKILDITTSEALWLSDGSHTHGKTVAIVYHLIAHS